MDAYLDFRFHPQVSLRAGQAKIPFTRYRIGSYKDLTLVEWSMLTGYFGAERQLGLTLHNGWEKPPWLEYELGLYTGVNARASHAVALSRLFGETIDNPSSLVDGGPVLALHPELVAHLALSSEGMTTSTDTDFERGPLRASAGLSFAWDLQPDRLRDLSMRLAPELLLKYRGASFSSVFYVAFARTGDTVARQQLVFTGFLFQGSYLLLRWLELAIRYSLLDVNEGMADRARARAAQIVATAAPEKAPDLVAQYKNAGSLRSEQELTFGVNLYVIRSSLKWQNDFAWTRAGRYDGEREGLRYRSQLQLSF